MNYDDQHLLHPKYRPDVDGLRAVAVISVVGFHAFPGFLKGGFVGVDVFFVISGFLITTIIYENLDRGAFSFAQFYGRRIRRIFPALMSVLAASYALGWFALLASEYQQLGKHITAAVGFISNFVFWNETGYFDNAAETKPMLHLWSLGIEEQFYIVWPLLLWIAWRKKLSLIGLTFLLAGLSFLMNVVGSSTDLVGTFYAPHTRAWELLVGAMLALLTCRQHRFLKMGKSSGNALAALGMAMMIVAVVGIRRDFEFPGWWAALPVIGAAFSIAAGPGATANRKLLSSKPMVWIGRISYPLYLWHWPILSFAHVMEEAVPPPHIRVAAVAMSIFLAWLTYRYIERPLRFGPPRTGPVKVYGLLATSMVIGIVALVTYHRDGFEFRLEEFNKQQSLAQAAFDDRALPWASDRQDSLCKKRFDFPGQTQYSYCSMTRPDREPTILVMGDSHAAALYPGLHEKAGSRQNVLLLGIGACLPFVETRSYQTPSSEAEKVLCENAIANAFKVAESVSSLTTVIVASRGPYYLEGKDFGDLPSQTGVPAGFDIQNLRDRSIADRSEIWEAGMRATLSRLVKTGKKIYYVLDNPELGFNARTCVDARPLRVTGWHGPSVCAVSVDVFEERNRHYRSLVAKVAKDFPAVRLLDAASPFCDDRWCYAMRDGSIWYRDSNHLTVSGAERVAAGIETVSP